MTNYLDDYQWQQEQARKAEAARQREELQRANAEAKRANEADQAAANEAQRQRDQAAATAREAEFKAAVRAEYAAMDPATFDAEWPRLRAQAMERASAQILAKKTAEVAGYF